MSCFTPEVQGQAEAFAAILARTVQEYFRDKAHRAEFERWYEARTGQPYQWPKAKKSRPRTATPKGGKRKSST